MSLNPISAIHLPCQLNILHVGHHLLNESLSPHVRMSVKILILIKWLNLFIYFSLSFWWFNYNHFMVLSSTNESMPLSFLQFNDIVNVPFSSEAFVAGCLAYFLDNTLHRKDSGIRKDRGKHWWDKFRSFKGDTRSEEFYSLPFNLNKYFPSVW